MSYINHQTCRNPFGVENHFAGSPRVGDAPTLGYWHNPLGVEYKSHRRCYWHSPLGLSAKASEQIERLLRCTNVVSVVFATPRDEFSVVNRILALETCIQPDIPNVV
jgi:hypothetical protein